MGDLAARASTATAARGSSAAASARMQPRRRRHRTSRPSTADGPQADCWVYEDLVYIHKRHVAAVGFDRDDMTMSPITYDEMRPGCYDPKARVEDMDAQPRRGVAVLPDVPALLRPDLHRGARTSELGLACVRPTTTGWSRSGAATPAAACIPLCIIPLWDAELAAAEVRRNADARRARRVLQRDPAAPRPAVASTPATGTRSSRACEETEHGHLHAHRLVVADAGHVGRRARRRSRPTLTFNNAMASMTDWLFSGVLVQLPRR